MPKKKRLTNPRRTTATLSLKVLVIDSNFDSETKAAFKYRQRYVYPLIAGEGFRVLRCQGRLARRTYVEREVRQSGVVYLTGVGHGLTEIYFGDRYDIVFQVGNYDPAEPSGKVVHFLSCFTAAALGPDFVNNGCLAYFGYDEEFSFHPNYADIFFECDSEIDRLFAKGLTAKKVYERVIKLFDKHIADLIQAGHDYVADMLSFDKDHLMSPSIDPRWGDPQAKIV